MTLGILDWGIGGVGLVRALRARQPGIALAYWSDTGATPYGKLPRRALAARVGTIVEALAERGATRVVVACHSASTVVRDLRPSIPVAGILEHGVAVVRASGARRVGVLGGRRTIRSGHYRRALAAAGVDVWSRVAQPLSALVERGVTEGPELDAVLGAILRSRPPDLEALLLACTHYPAVADAIGRRAGVPCLDPAEALAEALSRTDALVDGPSSFVTTGDPGAMKRAAARAWQVAIEPLPATFHRGAGPSSRARRRRSMSGDSG